MALALQDEIAAVERRLQSLRTQAGEMESTYDLPVRSVTPERARRPGRAVRTFSGDAVARDTSRLDPSAPDFLTRLAELKEQHARHLQDLEQQLQSNAGRPPSRGRSPARRSGPEAVRAAAQQIAEIDSLLATSRPRVGLDTGRLDAARRRWRERPHSAPPRRPPRPRNTVPEPFEFEHRDAVRRRVFAEGLEEERRRQSEGEVLLRPFKARPVPVSTVEPRYERMLARAARRRQHVVEHHREILQQMVEPFSFDGRPQIPRGRPPVKTLEDHALEHRFKAKPVPRSVSERLYERMQVDDAVRKERVSQEAQEKLAQASLPPRMERHEKTTRSRRTLAQDTAAADPATELFKPKINPMSPSIPPFREMQVKFEQALAKRKRSVPPTTQQPFSMYTDRRPSRMDRVLRDVERDALVLPEQRWPHASTRVPRAYEPVDMGPPPISANRTTRAELLRRASLEDEQEYKQAISAQRRREAEERSRKQKTATKQIAAVLKPTFVSNEAEQHRRREQFIAGMRKRREEWESDKKGMETRASARPYLFERASIKPQVDRATQERLEQFEQTLRDNGLGDIID